MHVNGADSDMDLKMVSKGCTILVVDDDPACLDEYNVAIENLGIPCDPRPAHRRR